MIKAIVESLQDLGEMFAIVLLCVGAAVLYGICHDQITARICIEYFSVFHSTEVLPEGMDPTSPTQQGFFWGVFATWWMGMFIGVPLSIIARVGSAKPLSARDLLRPMGVLLAAMAICTLIAGTVGYFISPDGTLLSRLFPDIAAEVPASVHSRFLADYFAHNASYFVGGIGGVVLIIYATWRRFRRPFRPHPPSPSPVGRGGA
jgi:hypothetical protein